MDQLFILKIKIYLDVTINVSKVTRPDVFYYFFLKSLWGTITIYYRKLPVVKLFPLLGPPLVKFIHRSHADVHLNALWVNLACKKGSKNVRQSAVIVVQLVGDIIVRMESICIRPSVRNRPSLIASLHNAVELMRTNRIEMAKGAAVVRCNWLKTDRNSY